MILYAFAGHYIDKNKNLKSTSGGAATIISELVLSMGGIVYGAEYRDDLYSAGYGIAESEIDLDKFKGSKYALIEKQVIRNGKKIGVYIDVSQRLAEKKIVLFIGLGCDIGNLIKYLNNEQIDISNLYTLELICNGVTPNDVLREFVIYKERQYGSKMKYLNLRYKNPDWESTFIRMIFENGEEALENYEYSEFSYAFYAYKVNQCYRCEYKGISNHQGDLIIGDFWGCNSRMKYYDQSGVSLLIPNSEKGSRLLELINKNEYSLEMIYDPQYAINYQSSYTCKKVKDDLWFQLDDLFNKYGVIKGIHNKWNELRPSRLRSVSFEEIIVWGYGKAFEQNRAEIEKKSKILFICDKDEKKQGTVKHGILIVPPRKIKQTPKTFVLITVSSIRSRIQIINELLDMNILNFDFLENWIKYSRCDEM